MLTPFAQVVDLSRRNATKGYTEQQAVVEITLVLRAAYARAPNQPQANPQPDENRHASLRPANFWQNFQFRLKQRGKVIATRSIRSQPIYSMPPKEAAPILAGATVHLEYNSKDVVSEEATVENPHSRIKNDYVIVRSESAALVNPRPALSETGVLLAYGCSHRCAMGGKLNLRDHRKLRAPVRFCVS
jgi:hypothetical protein